MELRVAQQRVPLEILVALLHCHHLLLDVVQLPLQFIFILVQITLQISLHLILFLLHVLEVLLQHLLDHLVFGLFGLQLRHPHQHIVLITQSIRFCLLQVHLQLLLRVLSECSLRFTVLRRLLEDMVASINQGLLQVLQNQSLTILTLWSILHEVTIKQSDIFLVICEGTIFAHLEFTIYGLEFVLNERVAAS